MVRCESRSVGHGTVQQGCAGGVPMVVQSWRMYQYGKGVNKTTVVRNYTNRVMVACPCAVAILEGCSPMVGV